MQYLNSAGLPLPEIRPASPKPGKRRNGNDIPDAARRAMERAMQKAVEGALDRLPGTGGITNPTNPGGPIGGGPTLDGVGVPGGGATAPVPAGGGSKTGPLGGGAKQAKKGKEDRSPKPPRGKGPVRQAEEQEKSQRPKPANPKGNRPPDIPTQRKCTNATQM